MTKVAVYGSLREGMGNHGLLRNSTLVARTVTREPYAMYSLGGFPMVSLRGERISPIAIEVYDVDDDVLARLDMLEGYRGDSSSFYDRSEVETAEDGLSALIYHIEDRVDWRRDPPLVEHGDWVRYVIDTKRQRYEE